MLSSRRLAVFVLTCFFVVAGKPVYAISRDPLTVSLPQIQIMPGAQWYWVGEHMALNGMPMSIKMFTYRGKIEDVVSFYLSYWKSLGNGKINQNTFGSKKILGYELDGFYYSVQFESAQGVVQGKAVVTPTPLNYSTSKKSTLPIPPRTTVLSKVESLDYGRREETLSMQANIGISYVVEYYKDQLPQDGWKLFSSNGDMQNSVVLSFQRDGELLQLTATALQHNNSLQCQFLIHWIK